MNSSRRFSDQQLMAYFDGQLDPATAAEVASYVAQSPDAQAAIASLAAIGNAVRQQAEEHALAAGADNIASFVMAKIANGPAKTIVDFPVRRWQSRSWIAVAAGAGCLAVAACIALVVQFALPRLAGPASAVVSKIEAPRGAGHRAIASAAAPAEPVVERSVMVQSVEYGGRAGNVYYVPGELGTTAVVWIPDDDSGGSR